MVPSPLLIFVSGPYSAPTEEGMVANTERAMAVALELVGRGHWPFIPHAHTHYWHRYVRRVTGARIPEGTALPDDHIFPANFFYDWDNFILDRCDALYYDAPSPGADAELARAESLGLAIFRSMDEVPFFPALGPQDGVTP